MKLIKNAFIILLMVFAAQSEATAQLLLSGEIRPRLELRRGYRTLASDTSQTALFVSQRSRLNLDFNHEKFRLYLAIQDVRTWGDVGQLQNVPSQALHQGWGELMLGKSLSVKLGRQEIIHDDHRLMGNVAWVQQARSHDAAILKFEKDGWKVHAAGAYNNERPLLFNERYGLINYRVLSYLYINKKANDKFTFSIAGYIDGLQSTDTTVNKINLRFTPGARLVFNTNGLTLNGTFYYQLGKHITNKNISAFLFAINAFYKINAFTVGAGIDYISGTDALDAGNTKVNSFHTLFATNHKFYGYMDYFLVIPIDTKGGGLVNPYLKTKLKTSEKSAIALDIHYFMLASNVANPSDATQAIDKALGTEIDLAFNYNIHKMVNLKAGYSTMFATSSMEVLKGGDSGQFQQWGWIMITFKPVLFDSKKLLAKEEEKGN